MVSEATRERVVTAIVQQLRWAKIFSLRRREFGLRPNNDEALQIYNTSAQNDPMSITGDETTVLMYHCQCHVIASRRLLVKPYDGGVNEEIQNNLL